MTGEQPVNSNKTGTITVGKHAHTFLKPTVRGKSKSTQNKQLYLDFNTKKVLVGGFMF
jgi:hypothetical protein